MAQTIGERLKIARKAAHIRQEDAAAKMEMSRPTLSAIEKNKRTVLAEELIGFSELYHVDAMELLYGFDVVIETQKQRLSAYMSGFAALNEEHQKQILEMIQKFQQEE